MSTAELKELRDKINDLIDHADERILHRVYAMLEADAISDFDKEMERRFADYESGKKKGFTLAETEERARSAYKPTKK